MVKIRIIPSLLLKNKRLVKGVNFKNHLDAGDPLKTCVAHQSQFADEIILIDLDAYEKNISPNYNTIKKIAEQCFTPLTVGGNIDSFEKAIKVIGNGADKILLNSASEDKDLIKKVSSSVTIPVIAFGGVGKWKDFVDGIKLGNADAVSAGNIFHYTEQSTYEAKMHMIDSGLNVRIPQFYKIPSPRKPKYTNQGSSGHF